MVNKLSEVYKSNRNVKGEAKKRKCTTNTSSNVEELYKVCKNS